MGSGQNPWPSNLHCTGIGGQSLYALYVDERNAMDSYLDIPNNFYIPDGKKSRLLQLTDRKELDRKTIDGNEGFVLEIPFLEGAFGTKYFVINKITGNMMGIYDNKVELIEGKVQLQPFNLKQLNCVICTLKQRQDQSHNIQWGMPFRLWRKEELRAQPLLQNPKSEVHSLNQRRPHNKDHP